MSEVFREFGYNYSDLGKGQVFFVPQFPRIGYGAVSWRAERRRDGGCGRDLYFNREQPLINLAGGGTWNNDAKLCPPVYLGRDLGDMQNFGGGSCTEGVFDIDKATVER
ncbi:hypothetical protein BJ165DRAFT_1406091 [Panaeolus papilionaceus]|nr:hypothetical protein BJ165DRAFT_1406091 [Panaeolus papilionaceus]